MRGMLHGERPSGEEYYKADEVRNDPSPVQERLPILVGGGGEVSGRCGQSRATPTRATSAAASRASSAGTRSCAGTARKSAATSRRSSEPSAPAPASSATIPPRHDACPRRCSARNGNAEPWDDQPVGTVDQIVERLRPYLGIGFRHFIFGFPSPYDAESQERLINEVKPALEAS